MRSTPTVVSFVLILALPLIAYAGSKATAPGVRTVRSAIEAANARFTQAFERGDARALAGMYTPDAIVFPPDSQMVRGSTAIGQFWKALRDSGATNVSLTTLEVGASGNLAYEVGTATLTMQPEGKERTTSVVKYVVVWKRQRNGSWKLHRDIWNSLPARKS